MARTSPKRSGTGKRVIGPKTRFAPDLLALEDRSVPAFIYVDPAFTGTDGNNPNQAFNAGGTGPLGTVPANQLTFIDAGDPNNRVSGGTTANFATADITTAFNAARDNPGPDTILLSTGTFNLDNSQGNSTAFGGFNDNTYFFNADPLSILGSGQGASTIRPTANVYNPADPATISDPVFAVRNGADFTGSDFAFDGSLVRAGVGIGVSGGTDANLTNMSLLNFVAESGAASNGATFGFGLAVNPNAGGLVTVTSGTFAGNARAGVSVLDSNLQVLGGTFTGRGAGNLVDYGVQALGTSNVYVTGATISGYLGKAASDGSESAGLVAAQDIDPNTGVPVPGGAVLIAAGNTITGNTMGVAVGSIGSQADTSVALVNFNDLSNNARGLDATFAVGAGKTGVDSGIDGRNNYYGGNGPNRGAINPVNGQPNNTGATGDEQLNPGGTGSLAVGNVNINGFRGVTVPTTTVPNPTFVANPADSAGALATARAAFGGAAASLKLYVDLTFTGTQGGNPNQPFNAGGQGPIGSVPANQLTFINSNTPFGVGGVTATGSYAVPDLTTAFDIARDNPGDDQIFLAFSNAPFVLNNINGQSASGGFGGFNDNTYFFSGPANTLSIFGSGQAGSVIRPTADVYDVADPATISDPVFAVRQGADFTASDFTFDGAGQSIGTGIGVSGGTDANLTNVSLLNFVAESGAASNGATFGFGLAVNPNAGGLVTVTSGTFAGNARAGVSVLDSNLQVLGGTFTGRGAGNLVDYGVQALGTSNVYVSGATITGYLGQAAADGSESAGLLASQDIDPVTGLPVPGGATLIAAGNVITGNTMGIAVGSNASPADTSVAVANFNNLSNNARGLDATDAAAVGNTGVDSGIDGRFNFFGGTGPNRGAINPLNGLPNDTAAFGDELLFPGTGSAALGNVNIAAFRSVTPAPTTVPNPTFAANPADTAGSAAAARAPFLVAAPASTLTIYVNGSDATFTDNGAGKNAQPFNPSGVGPLGSQPAGSIRFVPSFTPYSSLGFAAGSTNVIAVPDLTTAFDLARDNGGADTILLAASPTPYQLLNAFGQSATLGGGFNDNTYFFSGAGNDLTVRGSGLGNSTIAPQNSNINPADPQTRFDPVFAVRQGADFTASDFTFDGITATFGGGIGISGGTDATLTRVALRNFDPDAATPAGGATAGYGLFVNPNAGGFVSVVDSEFSGNGRQGVGANGANLQVLGSTFTGRGAGDLVDYGVQAVGTSNLYVSGSRFSGYQGTATIDGSKSAGIAVSQDVDPVTGQPVAGGAQLLAVGNSLTGNLVGVVVGTIVSAGTDTSVADLRFNDLSGNGTSIDATGAKAGAGAVTAPNNYFGDPAGPSKGSPIAANGGNIDVTNIRPVTAPTITVASGFATATSKGLAAEAPLAGTAYVTDPRIQSPVSIAAPANQPVTGDVTFTVNYDNVLVNQDKTLFSAVYTPTGKAAQTFTSGQLVISAPTTTNGKSVVTVTVPAALLTGGPAGVVSLVTAPSFTTAQTGNLQLTVNGYQTAGAAAAANFGAANTGVSITPNPAATAVLTPTAPSATRTFAVTVAPGRTIASVVAASNNAAVTVTRVAGSPDAAPQFTVTSNSAVPGNAVVTVTATDSDGLTDVATIPVQFGVANTGVSLTPINNLTFSVNGAAQNVSTTVTVSPGRTIASVTATASPGNLVTVTRVAGSPDSAPQFTVTPVAGAIGSGVVTVRATDSDGISNSTSFAVQVGTGVSPTISGLPDQTIPFAGSTGPLTVNVAGGNQPLTVTATTSNAGVATVSVTGSGATRTVVVTANPALTTGGSTAVTLRVTDAQGLSTVESFNVTVAPQRVRRFAAGVGPGGAPVVQVYGQNGEKLFGFTAFELSFTGGVSVATGDVNGDGVDDIIAGASTGGGPRIRVISGVDGAELANFYAFEPNSRAGVYVAAGKVINTGTDARGYFREQIVVGAGEGGGPRVSTFDVGPGKGANPTLVNNFFAFEDTFRNGVTVAAGDLTGDGLAEIITGSGFGGGPRVRAFTATGASAGVDFFAFDSSLRNGVNVAAGPLDTSGKASIVAGSGPNGGSLVRVFSSTGTQQTQFTAYSDSPAQGVRVGTGQFTPSGPESILTGPGVGGGPVIKVFSGSNPGAGAVFADFAFEPPFRGGIFVG